MAHTDPTWNQEYWQIRSGDTVGLNVDSGWAAAENIDATIGTGSLFRIRFKVRDSTGDYAVGVIVKLQVNDGSGWVDCDISNGTTVPPALVVDSAQFTHGDATSTELLTSTTTYVNGEGLDTSITSGSVSAGNSLETEFEYCIMLMSFFDGPDQNQASDTLDFRLVESTGTIFGGTYDNPTITVSETAGYVGGCMVEAPGRVGPFCDSNGNLYLIIEPSHNTPYNLMSVIKSTDGGDTWREIDGTNRPTTDDLEGVDAVLYDQILHIVHHDGPTVVFHQFHTSAAASNADTWQTTDESITSGMTATDEFCAVAYRSDDTVVAFYSRNDGTNDRLYYKIRSSGGTWGSENGLDTTASVNFGGVMCVREAGSDIIHVAYKDQTNHDLWHKSLSAADSLSARESLTTDASTENCPMTCMVAWEDGSDEKVMVCYVDESELKLKSRIITNDGTPGTEQTASDNQVVEDQGTSRQPVADTANDGSTVWLLYADLTDQDLYRDENANGAGWGTDVEERDEISADWVRAQVFTHSGGNGGAKVLGYIVDEGAGGGTGYIWFDEYELPSVISFSATMTGASTTPDDVVLAVTRAFSAIMTGSSTTPDDAVLAVLRAFSATMTGASTTPDDAELLKVVAFVATMTGASTTPDDAVLAVLRSMSATMTGSSTTPDDVVLAVLRAFVATMTGASTTPDDAVLTVPGAGAIEGLGSMLFGGLTGGEAGGATINFVATMTGASTTPDTVVLAVLRAFAATMTGASATPDDTVLAVARAFAAVMTGISTTPDTAVLGLKYQLAATMTGASTTPDDVALRSLIAMVATMTGASVTPDTVGLAVKRALAATMTGASTTPDNVSLAVKRAMIAVMTGTSTAPDDAVLSLAGIISFAATMTGASTTPDDAALVQIARFVAAMAGASTTPDNAVLGLALLLSATMTGASTTPDDAALRIVKMFAAVMTGASTTPDDTALAVLRSMSATMTGASATPDDAALVQVLGLAAAMTGASATPDDATLAVARQFVAVMTGQSTTPDDVDLQTALFVGLMLIALTGRAPGAAMSGRKPGAAMSGRKPGVTFSGEDSYG
jgi:hypothetical protein